MAGHKKQLSTQASLRRTCHGMPLSCLFPSFAQEQRRRDQRGYLRTYRRQDSMTTPRMCDYWVPMALSANITEGLRWEYGYPDFSNGTKFRVGMQSCSSVTQRSVRVGPFASRAGGTYDITSPIIDSLLGVGDRTRILSFTAMPVTYSGEPVGYPPLYVHHIHVGRLTDFYDEHWFTSHGDFPIGNDFGIGALSNKGYTTFLPKGYSFSVDCRLPFAVTAILQDMRSISSAPELSIFVEVNFVLAPPEHWYNIGAVAQLKPATLVWNEAPHGPFGYSRFAVLNKPSMSWWTMRWPTTGELLPNAKLHSHYARHHRLFLIDAAPQKMAFFASHVSGIQYLHDSVAPTSGHETMLLVNLSHTEQVLSRLPSVICQDDGSKPSFLVATPLGQANASLWARRRELICNPYTLEGGRISTFVQLFRPVANPDVALFPMHTNTWFYIRIPGAASSSDMKCVSYRYATYRTERLLEPLQDEAFGSCAGKPALTAVADYVSNNVAGLVAAVAATAGDPRYKAASLVGAAEDRRISILTVSVSCMACLLLVGLLRVRAARARTLL